MITTIGVQPPRRQLTAMANARMWKQNANAGVHGGLTYNRVYSAQLTTNAAGDLVPDGSTRGVPMLQYRHTHYMHYFCRTLKDANPNP